MKLLMQDLAQYRIRHDISMGYLAKRLKMSRQQLNNIEKGNGNDIRVSEDFKQRYLYTINLIQMERKEAQ